MTRHDTPNTAAYPGQLIVGYPLQAISKVTGAGIETLFLWFSFIALAGAATAIYLVTRSMVNPTAAIATVLLAMFGSMGILILFKCGTIFSLINMWLILPVTLYTIVEWTIHSTKRNAIFMAMICLLFAAFHPTGTLLIPALGLYVAIILWKRSSRRQTLVTGIAILAACTALNVYLYWWPSNAIGISGTEVGIAKESYSHIALIEFLRDHLRIVTIVALAGCGFLLWKTKRAEQLYIDARAKLFVLLLVCFSIILIPLTFTGLHMDPRRGSLDLATLVALITACLVGIIAAHSSRATRYGMLAVCLAGAVPSLVWWLNYQGG